MRDPDAGGAGGHSFERRGSIYQQDLLRHHIKKNAWSGPPLETLYGGLSVTFSDESASVIAIAIRDSTYLLDFLEYPFLPDESRKPPYFAIEDFIINQLRDYSGKQLEKFAGVAMPDHIAQRCPNLCSRLWSELDIVPLTMHERDRIEASASKDETSWREKSVDELAESMARKCIRFFGPNSNPLLQVGIRGLVEVDSTFHIRLTRLDDYQQTVGQTTWAAVNHYASDLKNRKVKIAFFSSTPQGGGVALMRHALVRFSNALGTDIRWYVPKPRPGVYRITKTNHNILQGVSKPEERFTPDKQRVMSDWIRDNANRYWLCKGGPLTPPSEGGADIVIIDDPQMPGLIPLAKQIAPDRPVIFRSHIQIRSDLISTPNTPQAEAWEWFWERIKLADLFISHPVAAFVPENVPQEMVGYMPASTDWLDGLNKNMRDWDVAFYGRLFNTSCRNNEMPMIAYPDDEYIAQIARFDPSKGIFDVLESYEKLHQRLEDSPNVKPPKLLICGHSSIDDPDGSMIYDAALEFIRSRMSHLMDYICVMRLPPTDQILNILLSKAKIVLQLSTREGFEVKVSEAIHKSKPVIATMAGGIPLQVQDRKNGFLVKVSDTDTVAKHMYDLCTDKELYNSMSQAALHTVSDEVSTVGNTLCWLYMASKLTNGHPVKPNGRWINDMAREEAGQPYQPGETRLKRALDMEHMT
ncbi:hypothetical protein VTN77DRAFT_7257 [Rasamsonia byssochlamydoides]|uniref:uncharacterized protein n=1 Tax=Rasamsonia byssochlamydoides TaxID=89139 RepID=UPI0037447E5B